MFKTHVAFGFLAGIVALPYLHISNQILFISLVMLGALLPDIDHPKSKIGSKFKVIGFLFEHRGFFHSFFVIPLAALIIYYFTHSYTYILPLCIGYISHLISDAVTKEGIMPFHPLTRLRLRGFIRTGGALEHIFLFAVVILSVYKIISL